MDLNFYFPVPLNYLKREDLPRFS